MNKLSITLLMAATASAIAGCGMFSSSGASAFYDECIKGGENKEFCSCVSKNLEDNLSDKELEVLGVLTAANQSETQGVKDISELAGSAGVPLQEVGTMSTKISGQMGAAGLICK